MVKDVPTLRRGWEIELCWTRGKKIKHWEIRDYTKYNFGHAYHLYHVISSCNARMINPLGISFNARILGDGKYDEKPHAGWDHSLMKTTSREPSWVTVQGQKTFKESTPQKKTEHLAILCTFHHPASSNKTCSNIYFTPSNKIVNLSRIKHNHAWCRLVNYI